MRFFVHAPTTEDTLGQSPKFALTQARRSRGSGLEPGFDARIDVELCLHCFYPGSMRANRRRKLDYSLDKGNTNC